ncbi:winged helix-turn-helix transcriptional regulator [Singulisphaera sp. PoT]|uniref:winged helix-turn-helix transcriptional regulator n=1 Tax=Singulisphaera sp. PoT TaxID=3411797 RepID=UPI003BF5F3E3
MKSKRAYSSGIEAAFDVIGGKWKVVILWVLLPQPRRFGELKRLATGITEKMLIQQLRQMEADGIIRREVFHEIPPRVEYSLTEFGVSLKEVLDPLCTWGHEHMERISRCHGRDGCESLEDASLPGDESEDLLNSNER